VDSGLSQEKFISVATTLVEHRTSPAVKMDLATFRQALIRCGVTQALARNSIIAQGYNDMEVFARYLANDRSVVDFVKSVNKLPADQNGERPSIPFASIRLLQAMRHWTIERQRCGLAIVHNELTQQELERILERMEEVESIMEMKPVPPPLPDKFGSFGKNWRVFSEGFKGHCAVVRGTMNIPLAYILREHTIVTPEHRAAAYGTADARLMSIVRLQGKDYQKDNSLVWQLLRPLVPEMAAWNYVKQYDSTQDGRSACLALQTRREGEATVDARRAAAEEIIQTAKYTGKSKRFSIQNYINLLQGAFTELESIGDGEYALTEKQKVSIFTKGLVAEEYAATKHSIYQNEETRSDFQKCYAFVETMEQFKPSYASTTSFDRNVSETGSFKKGVDKGYRSPAQWAALSKEEKDKILSARGSKKSGDRKGKKGKKPDGNNKRKLESVVTEAAEAISAITDDAETTGTDGNSSRTPSGSSSGTSPADQFGRKAHEIKRIIQNVVTAAKGGKKSE